MSQAFLDIPLTSPMALRYAADQAMADAASSHAQQVYELGLLRQSLAIARGADHIQPTADHIRLLLGLLHHKQQRDADQPAPF
jgi:hypothetical protein